MKPRKTQSNTDQGLLALCSYSDNGAVHYDPLELTIQTYKGHNGRSDKGKKGEKGLLSAYQLTDQAKTLLDNWINTPIVVGKDLRYMMNLKGYKIDMADDNAFGIIRSKSNVSKDINIRLIVDVSLPGMLMYKLLLQLTHDYIYRYGDSILTKDKKNDKILKKDSRRWNEIAIQILDGDGINENVYITDSEPRKNPTLEEVETLKDRIVEGREGYLGAVEGLGVDSSLVVGKVNVHTSKPIKTLLDNDDGLSLLNINTQLNELEDLIVTLREIGEWKVPVVYEECGTGRYFTSVLQGYCKEVRYASLKGYYAYDIEAAHQNLLIQIMDREGVNFPELDVIREYVSHKKETRARLAKELMITIKDVKGILQVLTYGSRLSKNKREALYECCNEDDDTVERVKAHPWIVSYKSAFDIALDKMFESEEIITNAVGVLIDKEKSKNSQRMAHVLQGLERQSLDTIIEHSEFGDIALLLHDCVVFSGRVDSLEVSRVVEEETGFVLSFEEEKY